MLSLLTLIMGIFLVCAGIIQVVVCFSRRGKYKEAAENFKPKMASYLKKTSRMSCSFAEYERNEIQIKSGFYMIIVGSIIIIIARFLY